MIGVLHFVPHRLLNAHRACGVEDDEAEVGTPALQLLLCSLQGLGTIGKQVCLTQIFVENLVAKVVGSCIHQSCFDSGVDVFDIHQSCLAIRWAVGDGNEAFLTVETLDGTVLLYG